MKSKIVNENNFNRLAAAIIERYGCSYEDSLKKLENFKLHLICGDNIKASSSLQAALLTAINTGKRAFLGGVCVALPDWTPTLLPWPKLKSINKIVLELGGKLIEKTEDEADFTLFLGQKARSEIESLQIISNGWIGGIQTAYEEINLEDKNDFVLSGILAGALGVGLAFLRVSGIHPPAVDRSVGMSLWRPDLHWLDKESIGPPIEYLPKNIWMLGLGHLGQGYLWNLGLLPFENTKDVNILLQDYDRIVEANYSSGLLTESKDKGEYKTRSCARWLEKRGFRTIITERQFNENTKRADDEPFVALCGFDSAKARRLLETNNYDLIIECALGGNLSTFDDIILHTLPNSKNPPSKIWNPKIVTKEIINTKVLKAFETEKNCGILATTISSRAISASFIGAIAGSIVISELLRGLHEGNRYETIVLKLRDVENSSAVIMNTYSTESARNGFVTIPNPRQS